MSKPELDKIQIQELEKHIDYLMDQDMTFENKDEYYDNFGKIISYLKDTSFNLHDLSHTYRKDIESAVGAGSQEVPNESITESVKHLINSQIGTIKRFVEEQKKLAESLTPS